MKIYNVYINKKCKFFQTISIILILTILSYFLIYSKLNYKIVIDIVNIFTYTLIPSLFPFMLFSNILIYSGYFNLLADSKFSYILKKIFKISSFSASAIIFGFLFGYPNGARYVNTLYEEKKISFSEAEYLLMYVNNSSPAFILSSIGIGIFANLKIGILLLISHILASILLGKIYRYKYLDLNFSDVNMKKEKIEYELSFDVITKSIIKTVYTMCMIFGFMVIFVITNTYLYKILSIIIQENKYISAFMLCIIELTSGIKDLTNLNLNFKSLIILISFFLGFSSFSINFQIYSCVYKNKFRLANILKGKLLHGILSLAITYILLNIPTIYEYLNIHQSVNNIMYKYIYTDIFNSHIIFSCIIFLIHLFFFLFIIKKKRHKIVSLKGG